MKLFTLLAMCAAALTLLLLPGCGRGAGRPAASLSATERTLLDGYEQIRAALAVDDLKGAKRAGTALLNTLKAAPDAARAGGLPAVQEIAESNGLDGTRKAFAALSVSVAKLADGVEGYYIMESPMQKGAVWVQRSQVVDNPYAGKATRDIGTVRK